MYLIYKTEQQALNRSEEEGIKKNLSFHINGVGSRYISQPELTVDNKWALPVEGYTLTSTESAKIVTDVEFPAPVNLLPDNT